MDTGNRDERKVSRRSFLRMAGGTLSAISLGSMPLSGWSHAATPAFPESKCGGADKTDKRVLVAYASKYGSTAGVADAIGKELCNRGTAVDVCLVKNIGDLAPYRSVVIGSAIYMGEWLPEAIDFVKRNRGTLGRMPVAYFLVCITMGNPTDENRRKVVAYFDPLLKEVPQVKPVETGTFAGALDYSNLSWSMKAIMKVKGAPEGDFRRWDLIRQWAGNLHEARRLADSFSVSPA